MSLLIPAFTSRTFKEAFFAETSPAESEKKEEDAPRSWSTGYIIQVTLGLFIGAYAAYVSWSCNSKLEYSALAKVVFSFFAFIFGGLYLFLYVIMRMDACNRIPTPAQALAY